jgi:methionyl-tRNA formyltransferase
MQSFDISEKISHGDLNEKIGNLGADMIVDTVDNLEDRLSKAYEQPSGGVTYSQKISKESCRINWHDTAKNILRKVMAFSPTPAAWSEIDGLRIKILDADIMGASKEVGAEKTFGKLFIHENDLMVSCKDGFISILKLQPAGKNPMTGKDFIRGRRDLIGKIFS